MIVDFKKTVAILEHYGRENQKLKTLEELAELQEAILHDINKGKPFGILEELADVYIMLSQLQLIYVIDPDDLNAAIEFKQDRQLGRIHDELKTDCAWVRGSGEERAL